ncbi:uncharacterized protein [Montipora foliosa]|uniref:uncharacterized protein n=1 Tax=Montipora foliosa TaxID=591990 RepID=UPI0035F1BCEC
MSRGVAIKKPRNGHCVLQQPHCQNFPCRLGKSKKDPMPVQEPWFAKVQKNDRRHDSKCQKMLKKKCEEIFSSEDPLGDFGKASTLYTQYFLHTMGLSMTFLFFTWRLKGDIHCLPPSYLTTSSLGIHCSTCELSQSTG